MTNYDSDDDYEDVGERPFEDEEYEVQLQLRGYKFINE